MRECNVCVLCNVSAYAMLCMCVMLGVAVMLYYVRMHTLYACVYVCNACVDECV